MSRISPMFGLGVVDTRLSSDTLAAKGAVALASAYTEAGPVPGHPVPTDPASRWRPYMRGAQSVDLSLITIRTGYPRRTGTPATVAYRLGSDADEEDWRGWDEPNLLTGWLAPDEYQDENWGGITAAKLPDGTIVVVATVTADTPARVWTLDPRTATWDQVYDFETGPGLTQPVMLAADPRRPDRLLLWSGNGDAGEPSTVAYYSDDGGTTWVLYASGLYDQTVAADRGSVAVDPDLDWVMFHNDAQWASSDAGGSWERIDSALDGSAHSVVRGPTGYTVVYIRASDSHVCCRTLASARSEFSDAAVVEITGMACVDTIPVVDDDGTIYVYSSHNADRGTVLVHYSVDGGENWILYVDYAMGIVSTDIARPEWDVGVASGGAMYLIGSSTGPDDGPLHAARFGGWSNVEGGYYGDVGTYGVSRRSRAGYFSSGLLYLPYDTPANQGWSSTSTGTVDTSPATGQGLQLITTAGQISIHAITIVAGAAVNYGRWEACLQLNSGPVAGSATCLAGMTLLTDATHGVQVAAYFGSDGFEVRDVIDSGNELAEVALDIDGSAGQLYIRGVVRQGSGSPHVSVWYRLGEGSAWTRCVDDVALTIGSLSNNTGTFGHNTNGATTTNSTWRYYAVGYYSDFRHGLTAVADLDLTPEDTVLGISAGRPVPGAEAGYPIPDATVTGEDLGYLAGAGGPTAARETVSLPAEHTYGVQHVHPDESPSPRRVWKSTATTEVRLVYDQGSGLSSWYGGALFLAALRADFREATLAVDDGSGGITALGTLDKGWGSINFTRAGRVLTPRSGTATISRYLHEGELVDGYVTISTSGGPAARRIVRQSAGYWSTTAGQPVRIEIDGVDGTEDTSATGAIVHHSGVLVVYPSSETPRRYLRILITASQVVPDNVFTAGILTAGRIVGVGTDPSWDWSSQHTYSRTSSRGADQALQVRRTGPRRRTLTYGWTDGVDVLAMRTLSAAADHVAASGGNPIGTEHDAWTSPLAILADQMRSGEVPGLLIPRLPTADTTITDPSLYLYGRLLSDGVGLSSIRGTEGTDELLRVDSITFEELP